MAGTSLYVAPARKCGRCQLCCQVMGIEELDKPKHQICQNQFEGGCKIYRNRPASCAGFSCDWLRGQGTEEERPDKIGLFFHTRPLEPFAKSVVFCEEGRDGALDSPRAKALLAVQTRTKLVLVRRTKERFQLFMGPPAELDRVKAIMNAGGKPSEESIKISGVDDVLNSMKPT